MRRDAKYYALIVVLCGLNLILAAAILTNQGLITPFQGAARVVHSSPLFVTHAGAGHKHTILGDMVLGRAKDPKVSCVDGVGWYRVDRVLHKQVTASTDPPAVKVAHVDYAEEKNFGYRQESQWFQGKGDPCPT